MKPLGLTRLHHVALITQQYETSKKFYTEVLGFDITAEVYRAERDSWKLDLCLNGQYTLELFSFPNPKTRASFPEACGLRHIAFEVEDVEAARNWLKKNKVDCQDIRIDEYTGKRFFFFYDPDQQPIEIYAK